MKQTPMNLVAPVSMSTGICRKSVPTMKPASTTCGEKRSRGMPAERSRARCAYSRAARRNLMHHGCATLPSTPLDPCASYLHEAALQQLGVAAQQLELAAGAQQEEGPPRDNILGLHQRLQSGMVGQEDEVVRPV